MIIRRMQDYNQGELLELRKPRVNPHSVETTIKNLKSVGLNHSASDFYSHNSQGFRSEEFSKQHEGDHILFAGCSVTYGEGMILEETWAYKTYMRIAKTTRTSGFFNIAYPGAKILDIPNHIYKYVNKYGKPDTIFVSLPDIARDYRVVEDMTYSRDLDIKPVDMTLEFAYRVIFELNHYCEMLGINLIIITWDHFNYKSLKIDRSTFYYKKFLNADSSSKVFYPVKYMKNLFAVSKNDEDTFLHEFHKAHKDIQLKNFILKGFDDWHPGVGQHELYSQIAMHGYEVVKNENI